MRHVPQRSLKEIARELTRSSASLSSTSSVSNLSRSVPIIEVSSSCFDSVLATFVCKGCSSGQNSSRLLVTILFVVLVAVTFLRYPRPERSNCLTESFRDTCVCKSFFLPYTNWREEVNKNTNLRLYLSRFFNRSGSTHSLAALSNNLVPTEDAAGMNEEEQNEETRSAFCPWCLTRPFYTRQCSYLGLLGSNSWFNSLFFFSESVSYLGATKTLPTKKSWT